MAQTFIMIKPDGVESKLVGEVIRRFEKKRFKLRGIKLMTIDQSFAEKHYEDMKLKLMVNDEEGHLCSDYTCLVDYIVSGPVIAMIWERKDAMKTTREMIGPRHPTDYEDGTIRGEFGIDKFKNVIHGSDSVESANKEIALWFPEGPVNWTSSPYLWKDKFDDFK